jgi:hypothetical protein
MEGWIKLHRKLAGSPLWLSEPFTRGQAWVDMLMLASFNEGGIRVRGIWVPLGPGQLGWSEVSLCNRWSWSRGKVRRYLDELESEQQIFRQTKQDKGVITTVITITNWDAYQLDDTPDPIPDRTGDSTPDGQQTDTIKKSNISSGRKRKSAMPEDFALTPAMLEYALKQGIRGNEVEGIFEHFKDHHIAKGNAYVDWTAAWRTWCRNHINFNGRKPEPKVEPKSGKPFVKALRFDDVQWEGAFILWLNQNLSTLRQLGRQKAKAAVVSGHQETVGKHLDGKYLDLVLERIGLKDEARGY